MQKMLANDSDRAEITRRIAALTLESQRQWGAMSVEGMVCHLDDSYGLGLGQKTVKPVKTPLPRPIMKFIALRAPMTWPKNLMSAEEVVQGSGGTQPCEFTDDRARLLSTLDRFCDCARLASVVHPFFGAMTREDWLRWGYLHADHHLRQFSA